MILRELTQRPELFSIQRQDVSENGIGITFSSDLVDANGDLHVNKVCILKLDDFFAYNSRYTHNPPKVIDNLVVVKCFNDTFKLYLIELRCSNGKKPVRRLRVSEIEDKFRTAIHDFIETRYSEIFRSELVCEILAYLVSDPWKQSKTDSGREFFEKKLKLSALDAYASRKPFRVLGRSVFINPIMPPEPVIGPC